MNIYTIEIGKCYKPGLFFFLLLLLFSENQFNSMSLDLYEGMGTWREIIAAVLETI